MMAEKTVFAVLVVFLLAGSAFADRYSGGTGEPNNPYRVETPNDLNDIGNHIEDYNKCFILVSDINMAGFTYTTAVIAPDTSSSDGFQGTPFSGLFDGNDCNICNLTIDTAGAGNDYLGLFGQIGETGQVKNLGIEDVNIASGDNSCRLGGLCGVNYEGTINNCYATGSVTGGDGSWHVGGIVGRSEGSVSNCYSTTSVSGRIYVGGLVGLNYYGSVSSCYSTSNVSGDSYVGGLVGSNWRDTVSNCFSTGDVFGDYIVGGLIGYNYNGIVSNCYSTGDVSGNDHVGGLVGASQGSVSNCYSTGSVGGGDDVGGLLGYNNGSVSNCYSTGSVSGSGNYDVGGLVGWNYYGNVSNCYSSGSVSGNDDVGGLVGLNYDGIVSNCYSTGDVSGYDRVGGLVGSNYDSVSNCFWDTETQSHGVTKSIGVHRGTVTNVAGLTTAQMQTESTFTDAGWDFVEVWDIGENQTYPFLRVYPAGDINHDDRVNFLDFAIIAEHWLEEK